MNATSRLLDPRSVLTIKGKEKKSTEYKVAVRRLPRRLRNFHNPHRLTLSFLRVIPASLVLSQWYVANDSRGFLKANFNHTGFSAHLQIHQGGRAIAGSRPRPAFQARVCETIVAFPSDFSVIYHDLKHFRKLRLGFSCLLRLLVVHYQRRLSLPLVLGPLTRMARLCPRM